MFLFVEFPFEYHCPPSPWNTWNIQTPDLTDHLSSAWISGKMQEFTFLAVTYSVVTSLQSPYQPLPLESSLLGGSVGAGSKLKLLP